MAFKIGDSGKAVGDFTDFLNRKFSSYSTIRRDEKYGLDEARVVAEAMRRYGMAPTFMDITVRGEPMRVEGAVATDEFLIRTGYRPGTDHRPVLFTVCGTRVPWWVGPDADTARAVEDKWRWQPIGYPAWPFPMGPSITAGKAELGHQLNRDEPGFELRKQVEANGAALAGYSQGAVITSEVWEFDIKPADGYLHWVKPHMLKAVTWGNPSRELGRAWPDRGAPIAPANTSGVAYPADRLKDTPPWWRDYAHKGDLYASAEQGDSGEDKTAIWRIIRGEKYFVGPDTLLEQFLEITRSPILGAVAAFQAMLDAGMFFAAGLTPHTNYDIGPAIDYLRS